MKYIKGFIAAVGMFSIIPVPYLKWDDKTIAAILPTFPLVGVVLGLGWYGVAVLFSYLRLPITLTIPLLASFIPLMTGFIHLDGIMDTADALLSRRESLEERKRIMKDPHVGSFGLIAVIIYFIMLIGAIATIVIQGINPLVLLGCSVAARCVGAITTMALPPMNSSGYASTFTKNTKPTEFILPIAITVATIAMMYFIGYTAAVLGGMAAGLLTAAICFRNFKGFSGDLAGSANIVTELAILLFVCV